MQVRIYYSAYPYASPLQGYVQIVPDDLVAPAVKQQDINTMCNLLSEWSPSESAIELIKLNGIDDEQIERSLLYLKNQAELTDIEDVDGYDNWNAFFIMFCIKASKKPS